MSGEKITKDVDHDISGLQRVVQTGLWFEELETGVLYEHRPGRTMTETDNVLFSTLTMNTQGLHIDKAFSDAQEPFHERLVNSLFTLGTMIGQAVAHLTQGTTVANLGFEEVTFPAPLFHGDTVYTETVVLDKRESKSRPGQGVVTFRHVARNQHGTVVGVAVRNALIRLRPAGEQV
ncbi:MaoC family dehydratase [Nocardia sp. NBC_01329]|uniref:MaoC family dehydratase n=1 Tax=Nocardia sp. NBC_01329 TaxID=2903594 RepID=UPI002E0EA282|nr:MaoC family dehydratase [Nocardia sp. NBC_01329]